MGFMSAKEMAEKWNISQRRVSIICAEGRVQGAEMIGNMWIIPSASEKPIDGRTVRYSNDKYKQVKPFVKWAGGKGQILETIREAYPKELGITINKYAEPFVGGGAILFDILSNYDLKEIYISDINAELINVYSTLKTNVNFLINKLKHLEEEYLTLDMEKRKEYYYAKRLRFNDLVVNNITKESIEKAALFLFLNKTCFNGLYRVNQSGLFNVPMGSYKNPKICDEINLINVSRRLRNVEIICGDYKDSYNFIDKNTFVYFDPPYRPLTESSSFTSYSKEGFGDKEQIELSEYVMKLNEKGAKIVLSNSDPKNVDKEDGFFDELYNALKVERIKARRMINQNGAKRGTINELLIMNC